jgi:hypothetical protein
MKQIFNSNNSYTKLRKRQLCVLKQIKQKLITENAILVQADKGKTIVVVKTDSYVEKVQAFPVVTHFPNLPEDPTEKYQKLIQKTLQQYNKTIDKQKILKPKETFTPTLKAQTNYTNLIFQFVP